jgi:hypothetical protein
MAHGIHFGCKAGKDHVGQVRARQEGVLLGERQFPEDRDHTAEEQQGVLQAAQAAPPKSPARMYDFLLGGRHFFIDGSSAPLMSGTGRRRFVGQTIAFRPLSSLYRGEA